jgi:hypothetical protein
MSSNFTWDTDLSIFLSSGSRSLAMGRFLLQGALAVSIKFMVSDTLN